MSDSFITNIFSISGPIASILPNYELRQEQVDMAEAVNEAIKGPETLIVEAGTGVGKGFSYLIPVAEYVRDKESLAIVSTNTINLQEQLVHKDIPLLEKALGQDFKAVLVKGRHNYLCLRRLYRSNLKQMDLFKDGYEIKEFTRIVEWSYKTEDGSLYDMAFSPLPKVWDMVSANTENCLNRSCPYYKRCFFQKARNMIDEARILVVNHHLFFSNMAIEEEEKNILAEYDVLVFDEAHSIENVATEHLGISVSNLGIKYLVELLYNPKRQKGFLLSIAEQDSIEWVDQLSRSSENFFKDIRQYFRDRRSNIESDSLRIRNQNFIEDSLSMPLSKLVGSLMSSRTKLQNKEDELEINSFIRKLNSLKNSLDAILNQTFEDYVYWIECSRDKNINRVSLNAAPINIGKILSDKLFSMRKGVVLTSATLCVDNSSFRYFKERVGIKKAKELKVGSPFDYKNQVRMYIAKDMPLPKKVTEYSRAVAEKVKHYLELTNGNAFVLFTSYSLMNIVRQELEGFLNEKEFNLVMQGDGIGRSKMLSDFRKKEGSILFGVDSFWQGVDVQGKALCNVIITKLPFTVPDNPVIEARTEEIQKRGGDSFLEYSLPEAVLRFKQGFGRLIRSKGDTGIVAILDSRIINKPYGRQFLNSVPRCEIIIER